MMTLWKVLAWRRSLPRGVGRKWRQRELQLSWIDGERRSINFGKNLSSRTEQYGAGNPRRDDDRDVAGDGTCVIKKMEYFLRGRRGEWRWRSPVGNGAVDALARWQWRRSVAASALLQQCESLHGRGRGTNPGAKGKRDSSVGSGTNGSEVC